MLDLPPEAFRKADPTPDLDFYRAPRLVEHIDPAAVAAVTALYRETIPEGGDVLDLMSSWISHLPPDVPYGRVAAQGMNAEELRRNPRLTEWTVRDLNLDPTFPYADGSFDAVLCCVSVQYLQRPVEVWREALRVVRPGARAVVTFSNRCFPTKAVAVWGATDDADHLRLVAAYLREAGWTDVLPQDRSPKRGDPLFAVTATKGDVPAGQNR